MNINLRQSVKQKVLMMWEWLLRQKMKDERFQSGSAPPTADYAHPLGQFLAPQVLSICTHFPSLFFSFLFLYYEK